jgi:hypothetical protein
MKGVWGCQRGACRGQRSLTSFRYEVSAWARRLDVADRTAFCSVTDMIGERSKPIFAVAD